MFTSKGSGNIIFTLNSELLGYIWEHIIVDMVGSVGSVDANNSSIMLIFLLHCYIQVPYIDELL